MNCVISYGLKASIFIEVDDLWISGSYQYAEASPIILKIITFPY
jgi:hypothetical protein